MFPTSRTTAWRRPLAVAAVLAMLAVGCGDSGEPTSTAAPPDTTAVATTATTPSATTSTVAPTTTEPATPPATSPPTTTTTTLAGSTTTAPATTTTEPGASTTMPPGPPFATSPIGELDTFRGEARFALSTDGSEPALSFLAEGIHAGGDVDCRTSFDFAGLSFEIAAIVIGDTAWVREPFGEFAQTTADDPAVEEALGGCPAAAAFWTDFEMAGLPGVTGVPDVANGVPAQRLDFSELIDVFGNIGLFEELPEGITLDTLSAWVADPGGWLVRIEMVISASAAAFEEALQIDLEGEGDAVFSFVIDVTDVNDPSLAVSPP